MSVWPTTPDQPSPLPPHGALVQPTPLLRPLDETFVREQAARLEQDRWFRTDVKPHEPGLRSWLVLQFPYLKGDLDDIVQESYLRLMRARALSPITYARTYLFGIARNVSREFIRKNQRHSGPPVNELPESVTIDPEADIFAAVVHQQDLALLTEAIQSLPEQCRQVILLRTRDGLSYPEIAARLKIAEPTVRVQMARGIKRCHQFVRERDSRPPFA